MTTKEGLISFIERYFEEAPKHCFIACGDTPTGRFEMSPIDPNECGAMAEDIRAAGVLVYDVDSGGDITGEGIVPFKNMTNQQLNEAKNVLVAAQTTHSHAIQTD